MDNYVSGDLIFYRGKGVVSRVIELVTRGGPSHVGIIFQSEPAILVAESLSKGFVVHRLSQDLNDEDGEMWHAANPEVRGRGTIGRIYEIQEFVRKKLGDKYDYAGALAAGVHDLDRALKFHPHRGKEFCSEIAVEALQSEGQFPNMDPADITPTDLWHRLDSRWKVTKIK